MANRINGKENMPSMTLMRTESIHPTEISGSESDEHADDGADDRGTDCDDHGYAGAVDDTG